MSQTDISSANYQINSYYEDAIRVYSALSKDEERLLIENLKCGGIIAQRAKEQLILANTQRVIGIAIRYVKPPLFEIDDAVQAGNIGLMRGSDKFDPYRGYTFGTYVTWWIRQSISREYIEKTQSVFIPEKVARQLSLLRRLYQEYAKNHDRKPSMQEIQEALGFSHKEITKLLNIPSVTSYDLGLTKEERSLSQQSQETIAYLIGNSSEDPAEIVDQESLRDIVLELLSHIPERKAQILIYYWGLDKNRSDHEGRSYEAVGKLMGVTRERVRQIADEGIILLRKYIETLSQDDQESLIV